MPYVQVGRHMVAVKFDGTNVSEILDMFAPHAVIDGCTISAGPISDGIMPVNHAYPGQPASQFKIVAVGGWTIADWSDGVGTVSTGLSDEVFAAGYRSVAQIAGSVASTSEFMTAATSVAQSAVRAYGASRAVGIPAAVSLAPGTRSVAVTWPRTLPATWATGGAGTYDVDISPDVGLLSGSYTYSVTNKTLTGCTLNYTNAALIVSLAAGTVDLVASK